MGEGVQRKIGQFWDFGLERIFPENFEFFSKFLISFVSDYCLNYVSEVLAIIRLKRAEIYYEIIGQLRSSYFVFLP